MTRIAISWLVYRLTKSALLLGLVGFADRFQHFCSLPWPRHCGPHGQAGAAGLDAEPGDGAVAGAGMAYTDHRINIYEILALSVMQGFINAFDMPGRQSFM